MFHALPCARQKVHSFWRAQGKGWNMGLSRYPSGRIHVDRTGWRTWGEDYTCLLYTSPSPRD